MSVVFRKFENFDPRGGVPARDPFNYLSCILARARTLLQGRTRAQISTAARNAEFFIDEHFRAEKEKYIQGVVKSGDWDLDYLPADARNEAGLRALWGDFDAPSITIPGLPTRENTPEVVALKTCIDNYDLYEDQDLPEGRDYEYFAVLALWLVTDAIRFLAWNAEQEFLSILHRVWSGVSQDRSYPPELQQIADELITEVRRRLPETIEMCDVPKIMSGGLSDVEVQLSSGADYALRALDAVCYAEQLWAVEMQGREAATLRTEMEEVVRQTERLADEKATQRISVNASKAAISRHAEHYAMRGEVFEWCAAHLNEYRSMDAAAEAVVAHKLVPVVFRTVRTWIGEFSKARQSARRL